MDSDYDSGVLCDGCSEREGYAVGANGNLLCKQCYAEFSEELNKTYIGKLNSHHSARINISTKLAGKRFKLKMVK